MRLTKNEKPIFFMMLIMVFLAVSFVTWTVTTTQSDNPDSLQSDLDDKIMQMNNERNRHLSQMQYLEISHDVEISKLKSEYEKKMTYLQQPAEAQNHSQEIQSLKDEKAS